MKHKHWWCHLVYSTICAPCRLRRLRYGYRLDPVGYKTERDGLVSDMKLTVAERLWVLANTPALTIQE